MNIRTTILYISLTLTICSCNIGYTEKNDDQNDFYCGTDDEILCGTENPPEAPIVFKKNCGMCHSFNKNATGPKLENILSKVPSEKWFDDFVKNEDSLTKIKDDYTLKIQEWSPVKGNHNFKELTEKQLREIKDFLNSKK